MSTDVCTTKQCRDNAKETGGTRTAVLRPPIDVLERDDAYLVAVDMPGIRSGTTDVHFERDLLTIEAELAAAEVPADGYLVQEVATGTFRRSMRFEQAIDVDGITAEYRNGVLTVRLPKPREATFRKIRIEGTST